MGEGRARSLPDQDPSRGRQRHIAIRGRMIIRSSPWNSSVLMGVARRPGLLARRRGRRRASRLAFLAAVHGRRPGRHGASSRRAHPFATSIGWTRRTRPDCVDLYGRAPHGLATIRAGSRCLGNHRAFQGGTRLGEARARQGPPAMKRQTRPAAGRRRRPQASQRRTRPRRRRRAACRGRARSRCARSAAATGRSASAATSSRSSCPIADVDTGSDRRPADPRRGALSGGDPTARRSSRSRCRSASPPSRRRASRATPALPPRRRGALLVQAPRPDQRRRLRPGPPRRARRTTARSRTCPTAIGTILARRAAPAGLPADLLDDDRRADRLRGPRSGRPTGRRSADASALFAAAEARRPDRRARPGLPRGRRRRRQAASRRTSTSASTSRPGRSSRTCSTPASSTAIFAPPRHPARRGSC